MRPLARRSLPSAYHNQRPPRCQFALRALGKSPRAVAIGDAMPKNLRKLTPNQASESVELYNAGQSLQQLGERYGVSRQSMWDLLRRRTTLRPRIRLGADNTFWRGGIRADDHAQNVLEQATSTGKIDRQPCERCGATGTMKDGRPLVQAHHDDYSKPLEVRWLCQPCHHNWHRYNTAKGVQHPART